MRQNTARPNYRGEYTGGKKPPRINPPKQPAGGMKDNLRRLGPEGWSCPIWSNCYYERWCVYECDENNNQCSFEPIIVIRDCRVSMPGRCRYKYWYWKVLQ